MGLEIIGAFISALAALIFGGLKPLFEKTLYPKAEKYYQSCLSIPIFPDLKKKEINYVINKINSIVKIK